MTSETASFHTLRQRADCAPAVPRDRLARSLHIKARLVGHYIGLMAYAYTAQFPNDTEKLAVVDAFLPGVEEWEAIDPSLRSLTPSKPAWQSRT